MKSISFKNKITMPNPNSYMLLVCIVGIYASFLTWSLVQEPLATKVWPNSGEQFKYPNIIAISQASVATLVGYLYLKWKRTPYHPWDLIRDHKRQLLMISLTQSTSSPLATYALQQVDYLTYMLAKSCKMIPVLLVHLFLYRTPVTTQKKIVAVLVSVGVAVFSLNGYAHSHSHTHNHSHISTTKFISLPKGLSSFYGFGMLGASLFFDGLTNATQDKMLKSINKSNETSKESTVKSSNQEDSKKTDKRTVPDVTGAHLMFALNLFMVLWNLLYLNIADKLQLSNALRVVSQDPEICWYLTLYSLCGAVGQCFIFHTLESYGSLVLITITVTRKMMSMMLSIVVYGKSVTAGQWAGILIVFSGITWEALEKRRAAAAKK